VVNYGIRGYVCKSNETVPDCNLACELSMYISSVSNQGAQMNMCRLMTVCNLATCPDPNVCLGPNDIRGCSPVANLNNGERIVYQLFDVDPDFIQPDTADTGTGVVAVGMIVGVVIAVVVVAVVVAFVIYYLRKRRQGGNYFWNTGETI